MEPVIDGDNVAKPGAACLKAQGLTLQAGPYYRRDVFLWMPRSNARDPFFSDNMYFFGVRHDGPPPRFTPPATRAYYYTSTTSDEPEWTETRVALRDLGFEARVAKRAQGRAKTVDLALATEALLLAAEGASQGTVIFTGDGDYLPVIEAIKRLGQKVLVGAFHGDASVELRIAADWYFDLTPHFLNAWQSFDASPDPDKSP